MKTIAWSGGKSSVSERRAVEELLIKADIRVNGSRPWDMQVRDERVFSRALAKGNLGLGEAYMSGWWEVEQLDEFFFRVLRSRLYREVGHPGIILSWLKARLLNLQSPYMSQRVARLHYDLGNVFYEHMLDPWMQYTCAYWKDAGTLEEAQEAKLDLICRKLHLREGMKILELGGGWGGFAKFAAERYGCRVTSYNISERQVEYARSFCAGLSVDVVHGDYRKAEGEFDRVVSIGICEHVGSRNYREFMAVKDRCMREGGLMFLHTIGCNITKHYSDPWITRYIFPGGELPSFKELIRAAEGIFILEDMHNIGAYYDPTLMAWFRNFDRHWPEFRETYGDTFYRMWKYYLLSCAGAFRARNIQLWQLVFSREGVEGGYVPVR